jgi:hypothetical protein
MNRLIIAAGSRSYRRVAGCMISGFVFDFAGTGRILV